MQYQGQENINFVVQNNQNQMIIDGGNSVPMQQQTTSDFEWLNLMNQDSQQPQHWQQPAIQRRQRANTIATAPSQTQYQVINQPVMNQQQQMLNQQQIINQQQQQIMGQQQQIMGQQPMEIVNQPTTLIINQTQATTQQPILVQQTQPSTPQQILVQQTQPSTPQPILVQQQTQPTQIIVQQQPILVQQTSPQTPTQQIIVQEAVPVTTQNSQFMIAQQGRQRANTIPGSTAPPYPPQSTTSSPYSSSSVKSTVSTPPVGKIAISSNPTKSIPATSSPLPGMIPMMGFQSKLSRDLFTQSEHLRKLDEELDKVDFDDVTVYELKDLLRKRGLPSSGKKAILTERLLDEKRNAETRKRNYLEAEELRKKGQLNINGICGSNQIMDLYGGITALTTQELPMPNPVIASPSSVTLQPIMPMGVNQVKTRQRSYSDSRLTRPNIMEGSIKTSPNINSNLKNQISFQDVMQTDAVVTNASPNVVYAQNQNFQQVNMQPQQSVIYTQPQQNYMQIQSMSTDATWNQNNNMSKYSSSLMI
ncbi:hypothetical protein BCR36DRAFT_579486 [Piromyces finnis]|uniref:SAP domain-containing protein n=1 Tax=Piromyces finnis TaxID=1754191 RepID=A0A1Y1VM92_9FUNG|nr:hypothetical protein BCR36DRAFT_579486 [Piromyces finnis]|eukprot:ORX60046.1 hypothetical protein BCR36DRAFT_579486 [Piromyces finnis]